MVILVDFREHTIGQNLRGPPLRRYLAASQREDIIDQGINEMKIVRHHQGCQSLRLPQRRERAGQAGAMF